MTTFFFLKKKKKEKKLTIYHFFFVSKDPSGAIPKGTLLAIVLTSLCYAGFVIAAGGTVWRDADGNTEHYINGTYRDCLSNFTCPYGLQNNYQVSSLLHQLGLFLRSGSTSTNALNDDEIGIPFPDVTWPPFQITCNYQQDTNYCWAESQLSTSVDEQQRTGREKKSAHGVQSEINNLFLFWAISLGHGTHISIWLSHLRWLFRRHAFIRFGLFGQCSKDFSG